MSYASKSVAAVVGLVVIALLFSRQLFLFTVFSDPQGLDPHGGKYHLGFSLMAAVFACVAAALMFYFLDRHDRDESSQRAYAPPGPVIAVPSDPTANSPAPGSLDTKQWAQLNPWLSEGQDDDRRPMDGSVADRGGTASGQRTLARESHQLKFKKWSQGRRD